MNNTCLLSKILILIGALATCNCTSTKNQKLILLKQDTNVETVLQSSCKISAFEGIVNDAQLKKSVSESIAKDLKSMKIKTSTSLKKANYRIKRTKVIIAERCGVQTVQGGPFVGFKQIITLENIATGDSLFFSADTTYVISGTLNNPTSLIPKKIEPNTYMQGLSKKNIKSIKSHFK